MALKSRTPWLAWIVEASTRASLRKASPAVLMLRLVGFPSTSLALLSQKCSTVVDPNEFVEARKCNTSM